jgi:hypothetical protein
MNLKEIRCDDVNTFVGIPEENDNLGDLDVDGRKTIKCYLKRNGVRMWTGFI